MPQYLRINLSKYGDMTPIPMLSPSSQNFLVRLVQVSLRQKKVPGVVSKLAYVPDIVVSADLCLYYCIKKMLNANIAQRSDDEETFPSNNWGGLDEFCWEVMARLPVFEGCGTVMFPEQGLIDETGKSTTCQLEAAKCFPWWQEVKQLLDNVVREFMELERHG